jgi:pimeloyl-ACP methyl ester carboxylesterase
MAKGEIVKFLTEDNIELQGFFVDSNSSVGLLHIHGHTGNFYENSFIDHVGDFCEKRSIKFLSANNRGHGYLNELVKIENNQNKFVVIGGALEKFEDCIIDIKAGIKFLKEKGCKKIILQGHSTGCQKITYYQSRTKDRNVIGLILLAPADDKNVAKKILGNDFDKAMQRIEEMVKNEKEDDYMPKGTVDLPLISAGRLFSFTDPTKVESGLFDYYGKMKELGSITLPILAIFGSKDIYLTMSAEESLEILKKKAKKSKCETDVIKDAPHNFRDHEKQLIEIIDKWTKKVV